MDVFEAVASRYSCRAFLPTPVPHIIIREIIERAARAPSAGNMQPWRAYAIAGQRVEQLKALLAPRMATDLPKGEGTDYTIYPEPLTEPYRSRRFTVGELLYRRSMCRERTSHRATSSILATINFLAPRLPCFSHAKRLTDLHNGQISAVIFRPLPCWRAGSDCIPVRSRHGSLSTAQCVFFCDFPTI